MLQFRDRAALERAGEGRNLELALDVMRRAAASAPCRMAEIIRESLAYIREDRDDWRDALAREVPEIVASRHVPSWGAELYEEFLDWRLAEPGAWEHEQSRLVDAATRCDAPRLRLVIVGLRVTLDARFYARLQRGRAALAWWPERRLLSA